MRERRRYVTLKVGRDARVPPDKLVERLLVSSRADNNESADVEDFGVHGRSLPRLARRPDGPRYSLGFGANGNGNGYFVAEPGANVYDVRSRAEHVDRDLRFVVYRQPAYAALETVDIDGVAAQVTLEFS